MRNSQLGAPRIVGSHSSVASPLLRNLKEKGSAFHLMLTLIESVKYKAKSGTWTPSAFHQTLSRNLLLLPGGSQKCLQLRLLLAKSHPLRIAKRHISPRPRRRSRLSGGVKFDVSRDLLVLWNHMRKEIQTKTSCNVLIPTLFSMPCLSARTKSLVQPPPEFSEYPNKIPGSIFVPN